MTKISPIEKFSIGEQKHTEAKNKNLEKCIKRYTQNALTKGVKYVLLDML